MAEMLGSAFVQEAVSRAVSFVLGKREEKASQGHLLERLEMAVSQLEFALERAKELPIRHLSLLCRRKQIKSAYIEATELLDKHKQQVIPVGLEENPQGAKRKRWGICAKNMSLSTDAVRRFEWYADHAGRFVRDVESGCSLYHYTFCNPIVRHLLEGKTLMYSHLEQGNLLRGFYIWPTYSDERGVEVVLSYHYGDSTMDKKYFSLVVFLRLSESTDIVGLAIKGLQLLSSGFKLAAEFAMGELTQLSSNAQDIAHSCGPPRVGIREQRILDTKFLRPNPACCKGSRHGLCANNNASPELLDIFPEQVIFWSFQCYYVREKHSRSSCSSFDDAVGGSKSRGVGEPPLLLRAVVGPHIVTDTEDSYALEITDVKKYRDASIQQVTDTLKSNTTNNCFFRHPEQTEYRIGWYSKHGVAGFMLQKTSMESTGTRGSTRRSRRR